MPLRVSRQERIASYFHFESHCACELTICSEINTVSKAEAELILHNAMATISVDCRFLLEELTSLKKKESKIYALN